MVTNFIDQQHKEIFTVILAIGNSITVKSEMLSLRAIKNVINDVKKLKGSLNHSHKIVVPNWVGQQWKVKVVNIQIGNVFLLQNC